MRVNEEAGRIPHEQLGVALAASRPPAEPSVRIRPNKPWAPVDLGEVWEHRQLLLLLVLRDLKLRYHQTLLGATWVVLQPLMMTLVLAAFLGLMARPQTDGIPYPLFLYAGLLPWTFFSNAVLGASYSLVTNADLVSKIYFPRLILPAAAVGVRLADFVIAFVALLAMMLYYGVRPPAAGALLWPLVVLNLVLLAAALGALFASLHIRYRDVGTVLPVLLQLWMFASPILYPSGLVPEKWRWAYYLNPLAGGVENFRAALFGLPINRGALLASAGVTAALVIYTSFSFRRMEDEFADSI
ncbi:MAG TPA: ABC transporter permease [Pyrinomonadaceae bacterium]|nr:ABC transporter permease [Pyrinomonadaceae bacterium]